MTQGKENVVEQVKPSTRDELDTIGANVMGRVPQTDVMYVCVELAKLDLVLEHLMNVPEIVEVDLLLLTPGQLQVLFQLESRHDFPAWARKHLQFRQQLGILGYEVEGILFYTYPKTT